MTQKAWLALKQHAQGMETAQQNMARLFADDPKRFERFSVQWDDVLFDYSKQRVTGETLERLMTLAQAAGLSERMSDLFQGKCVNASEGRPALHTALRDFSPAPLWVDGRDVKQDAAAVRREMRAFVEAVHQGHKLGVTGKPIQHCLCLGIGGSDLGPMMVCEALAPYRASAVQIHFLSNTDEDSMRALLSQLPPEQTWCVINSKTFTTLETLSNAARVKEWFLAALGDASPQAVLERHFGAVTAAPEKATQWGIATAHIFPFWSWVGGRFSVWSAVGLPIALLLGMDGFHAFLEGAHAVDVHFRETPFERNIPVLMGLLGVWNASVLNMRSHAVLPYADGLRHLPSYLQQLEMESNGKAVDVDGEPVAWRTAPVIWGGVGCNGQHAYMQLLHQGTDHISMDFLMPICARSERQDLQKILVASGLSQSKALMQGQTEAEVPLKSCDGDRPSTTLMFPQLTPTMLGKLLALYEHKVFVQGVVWGINSFDQWGVELGKTLTQQLLPLLNDVRQFQKIVGEERLDSSTAGLMTFFHQHQRSMDSEEQSGVGDGGNGGHWNRHLHPIK